MRLRFKSMLCLILIMLICCISLGIGYIFYDGSNYNDAIVIVDGDITINYLNGNEFKLNNDATLSFSVTNNSSEQAYYYIQFSDIKADSSQIHYTMINEETNTSIAKDLKSEIISNSVVIDANHTDDYKIEFKVDKESDYSGKIVIGLMQKETKTFKDLILENNEVKDNVSTPLGDNSTIDEGLIKNTDDLGDTYYFRGNVQNNYVSFAGLTWRIVRINGDNSVKLVLDGIIDVLTNYYDDEETNFDGAIISESLSNWYNLNLTNYSDYIANYRFCNDLVFDNNLESYISYNRIFKDKAPVFSCLGTNINSKIGLLTADEVMYAGASNTENKSYYLYNETITTDYYTMTSAKNNSGYYPFIVKTNGAISDDTIGSLLRGSRPVINIIANIAATGDGTHDNPYQIII